jgi:hypothetical protein
MAGSATLSAFYNAAQSNYLQAHVSIEENITNYNISTAQNQIAALSPANAIETNYKNFYQIFLNTKNNTYSGTDSLNLTVLANMCPYVDGAVVFQARALYNIIYDGFYIFSDNCSGNVAERSGSAASIQEKATDEAGINVILKTSLFPNPNDGNFSVGFNKIDGKQNIEISIFDITGREVTKETRFLEEGKELKINNSLLNGTYLVKVKFEDGTFDMHRLIIAK